MSIEQYIQCSTIRIHAVQWCSSLPDKNPLEARNSYSPAVHPMQYTVMWKWWCKYMNMHPLAICVTWIHLFHFATVIVSALPASCTYQMCIEWILGYTKCSL